MTRDELIEAFPIDGRLVVAGGRSWTLRVRDIVEAGSAFRVDIAFEGPDTYTATLHLDKGRLKQPENIREVDLMLADIAEWLQTNPLSGTRQIL
jgi:hypothetical protein